MSKNVYEWGLTLKSGVEIVSPELAKLAPWREEATSLYLACDTFIKGYLVSRSLAYSNGDYLAQVPDKFQLEWESNLEANR